MKKQPRNKIWHNIRFSTVLIFIPFLMLVVAIYFTFNHLFVTFLATKGSERLVTDGWESASSALASIQTGDQPKNSFYQTREQQDLAWAADHFGVPQDKLLALNPGPIVFGTTITVPPVEKPLEPFANPNQLVGQLRVQEVDGILHVTNIFRAEEVQTTIPKLAEFLAPYHAIEKVSDKQYRIIKPLLLTNNIRVDITDETVTKLELTSGANFQMSCLCFENATVLIKNTVITSYDPVTGQPDIIQEDGRSFIRALKSTRMDVINTTISYLGHELKEKESRLPIMDNGATYGVSWRIPDGTLGQELVTGWIENSTFTKNYFGAYTFGASGMMWRHNTFTENIVYGLDPHDDSNSATVEQNVFSKNGTHGFIVSKRCNYNLIRDNISRDNGLHGFMLHQDSVHNVIENNISIGNTDNFAIFDSDLNTIRRNKSYDARGSHVRINQQSANNFVQNNTFSGGGKGVYIYGDSTGVLISGNTFSNTREIVTTEQAKYIVVVDNTFTRLRYTITSEDRVVFGPNNVKKEISIDPPPVAENSI